MPSSFGKLLGHDVELQQASEPTDIIWENRHFKERTRTVKRLIVYTIIVITLAMSGSIIFVLSSTANGLKFKYPKTDCKQTAIEHGVLYKKVTQADIDKFKPTMGINSLERDAFNEFITQDRLEQIGHKTFYTEALQCFCKF